MKNKIFFALAGLLALFFTAGCQKAEPGLIDVTYYPVLTLEGDATLVLDKGSSYEEPGYTAILNGEDVSGQVVVSSNVNMNASGVYSIGYSIVNKDGFSSSASRTVIVLDLNHPVEGLYVTDPQLSYRNYNGITPYGRSFTILVIDKGDYYEVDDMLGGWYAQRAGYGSAYAMQGAITVDADGNVELLDSYVPGWGDSAESMYDAHFDAATSTFTWGIEYTANPLNFIVTMTKM